jgi:D-methionine transport system substrate-binding protein
MKKYLSALVLSGAVLALAACGSDDDAKDSGSTSGSGDAKEDVTLVIGASAGLHDIILEEAAPILAEEGIKLDIKPYTEYVMPNQDLDSEDLDANYFQHVPYLNNQVKEHGYEFANAGGVHVEPMGIYSSKYKSVDEIPDGATIIISNSVAEQGRILSLLEASGLIKLKEGVDKTAATLDDIAENPKNLVIDADSNPEILTTYLQNDEGDAVVINANFIIDAGMSPVDDSIAIEGAESDYVNIITVRAGDEKREEIQRLVEVLQSEEIADFILEEWEGAVVPVGKQ